MWKIQCEHLCVIPTKTEELYCCTKRKMLLESPRQCRACQKCAECVADKSWCCECADSFEHAITPLVSYFQEYRPVCPRGYTDCVCDPAYIKYYHPKWYKELYGDLSPEEAILGENGCMERYERDPDEKYHCYDDEDK